MFDIFIVNSVSVQRVTQLVSYTLLNAPKNNINSSYGYSLRLRTRAAAQNLYTPFKIH